MKAAEQLTYAGMTKESATLLQYNDTGYYSTKLSDDADWYKFQTPSNAGYTNLYFKNTGMKDIASIVIYNVIDEEISHNNYVYRGDVANFNFKLEADAVYYIAIYGGTIGSTYVLDLDFQEDAVGNSKTEATTIECNKEYTWTMDGKDDADYATFVASTTGKHKFYLKNTGVDTSFEFCIYKYSTDELLYRDYYVYKNETSEVILDLQQGEQYYIYFGGNSSYTGYYVFSVNNQTVTSIKLSKSVLQLSYGESTTLTADVLPKGAYNTAVTWASNNSNVASVDASGTIYARQPGQTLITCTANDGSGIISTCNVIVTPGKMRTPYVNTDNTTSSAISLSWNSYSGATGYGIYAYYTTSKTYRLIKTIGSENTTTTIKTVKVNNKSKKLSAGKSYKLKVAGYITVDGKKYYGPKSDALTASTAPAKVTLKSVTNPSSYTVKLTWNKVSGASGYYIYVKNYYGEYVYAANVNGGSKTSYNLNTYSTGTLSYKVCAYRTVDNTTYKGALSSAKTVKKVR